jgi:hypothetical protein
MDTTASRFTLRKNAKRAAEAMIRKGAAPAVDYGITLSDDGRFEIVWKIAKATPTTNEVEIEIAEASADQPVAASPTEAHLAINDTARGVRDGRLNFSPLVGRNEEVTAGCS